jgi:hypothetical protein
MRSIGFSFVAGGVLFCLISAPAPAATSAAASYTADAPNPPVAAAQDAYAPAATAAQPAATPDPPVRIAQAAAAGSAAPAAPAAPAGVENNQSGSPSSAAAAQPAAPATAGAAPASIPETPAAQAPAPKPPDLPAGVQQVPHDDAAFRPDPSYADKPYQSIDQEAIYGNKHPNKTQRPWVEWGRRQYDIGEFDPGRDWLGEDNLAFPSAMVYGDWRTAAAYNDNGKPDAKGVTHQSQVASRIDLDIDLGITDTERIHMFVRPLDRDGSFLRYDIEGQDKNAFRGDVNFDIKTLYTEGDLGSLLMGFSDHPNRVDLPFAAGLVPLFTQNGIWLNDAFVGGAVTIPAKNSEALGISNFDLTFFSGFDQISTPAILNAAGAENDHGARMYGFYGFVDANRGYYEFGYGYVQDKLTGRFSYSNLTLAFTRRYFNLISNSIRVITNVGQNPGPGIAKTADGTLILVENSLISRRPLVLVPYFNLFAGFKQTQALARAADTGGVLANEGINFESDGITFFPNLDPNAVDSYGGALGVEYLWNLDRQLVLEVATVQRRFSDIPNIGAEYALGARFQQPLNNAWILRLDGMYGFRDGIRDIFGGRVELRWKF